MKLNITINNAHTMTSNGQGNNLDEGQLEDIAGQIEELLNYRNFGSTVIVGAEVVIEEAEL